MIRRESYKSVLAGANELIDKFLECPEIGKAPHYKHKSTMKHLCDAGVVHPGGPSLMRQLIELISDNCRHAAEMYKAKPSKENWRFTQRTSISDDNLSPEVTLERAIAEVMTPEYANQVPTASGLTGPSVDKTRNIDLVRKVREGRYDFIELKVASNTPVMAAFEIYTNAATYLYYRQETELWRDNHTELLVAEEVGLRTLAPKAYYSGSNLHWLEGLLNEDIAQFKKESGGKTVLADFGQLAFPEGFTWPSEKFEVPEETKKAVEGIESLYS